MFRAILTDRGDSIHKQYRLLFILPLLGHHKKYSHDLEAMTVSISLEKLKQLFFHY